MSQGFGVDIYGVPFYGYSQPTDFSVAPFTATQADYGEITLQWAAPNATSWKLLNLVRSPYGYAATPADGVLLQQFTPSTIQKTYDDAGLTLGTIYYYTIFIAAETAAWNNGTTYPANAQVLYQGEYWTSLQGSNTNNTPFPGGVWWATGPYIPVWFPAGYAATLAMANEGYGSLLYTRTPQPYKIAGSDTFGNTAVDNPSLQHYLNVVGFGVDMLKNRYDSFLNINNPDVVSASDLDILGHQLGIATDYMSSPQDRRQRIKTATTNYQLRGEPQSIHNVIAQLAGWDSAISEASNLYVSGDQSNFVHPLYPIWNANTTYATNSLVQLNNYNYKALQQSTGNSQSPTGTNTSNTYWQVQINVIDTATLLNPQTGGYSTWSLPTVGSSFNGVMTGQISPISSSVFNVNSLAVRVGTGPITFQSTSGINTPNYSSGTNYVVNNYVLSGGIYYRAAKPSGPGTPYGAITPGTNSSFWLAFFYQGINEPASPNLVKDGAPLVEPISWNATVRYTTGQQVQFNGNIYQCALNHINQQPGGFYYSSKYWIALGPSQAMINSSAYFSKAASANGTSTASSAVQFYDANGIQIRNFYTNGFGSPIQVGTGFVARFQNDYASLNGTSEPSIVSYGLVGNAPWASTPSTAGSWFTSFGMACPNQTIIGTTTYAYSLLTLSQLLGRYCITFGSDYMDTAHKTHGLIFAWVDANNFWYATRQSLWKVVAGVGTKMLSWTRLNTGDRMVVDIFSAGFIVVYAYARDGKGTLTEIGRLNTGGPSSGTFAGVMQKYSATGAL
jgi:hypothetical protein